jgi:4-hydroxy-4-methyl-2-oxoglutarate aldolase
MGGQPSSESGATRRVTPGEILQLKRWNTPTIYNGWEQITRYDRLDNRVNRDETHDFMPQIGPMAGFAVTVVIQPSDRIYPAGRPTAWSDYRRYVASIPGPKIVVVQDLDKPDVVGAFWGEVSSSTHKALGCVGTITDGGIRDLDEMTAAGFKALARRLVVGHAFSTPIRWGCDVEVFGVTVQPGQLLHADKHGFLIIPSDEETRVLEAARFMDSVECDTKLPATWITTGLTTDEILARLDAADRDADLRIRHRVRQTIDAS